MSPSHWAGWRHCNSCRKYWTDSSAPRYCIHRAALSSLQPDRYTEGICRSAGARPTMTQASPTRRQLSTLLGVYEEMVESAHDGMLLVEDNIIIGCNPAACSLYGIA